MSNKIKSNRFLGNNIKKARNNKKLTQEELSAKLQTMGIDLSRGALAKIEVGIRHISVEELKGIKDILGISYDDLFN